MPDFSYFDQFTDVTVDLTKYLQNMSVSGYDYRLGDMQPVVIPIKNLFTHYNVAIEYTKNIDAILHYTISEGESVDLTSWNNYNTTEYWWIIYVFNGIRNPWYEWPFTQEQLNQIAKLLYEEEGKYSYSTYYKFLHEDNEIKRNIIIPKDYIIRDFIWSYREQIINSQ